MVGHRFNNVTKKTEEPLPKTVLLKILCNVCLWGPEARGAGKKKKRYLYARKLSVDSWGHGMFTYPPK